MIIRPTSSAGINAQHDHNQHAQLNEAEIRVFLALKLCHAGITFSCERIIPNSSKRYDIGVHHNDKLFALIEVKCEHGILETTTNRKGYEIHQREAYIGSGLPWRYCSGYAEVYETQKWVKHLLKKLTQNPAEHTLNPLQQLRQRQIARDKPRRKRVVVINQQGELVHPDELNLK
jgi:hypothetical protein